MSCLVIFVLPSGVNCCVLKSVGKCSVYNVCACEYGVCDVHFVAVYYKVCHKMCCNKCSQQ